MTNQIFCLESAGTQAWDVFTKKGAYAGLVVTKPDGTLRHRYNSSGTKGSARKFQSIDEVLENIANRRTRIVAKRDQ